MTNIDALLNASTANDLFLDASTPFVAHVAQRNTADEYSFEVVIEMVHVSTNGFLVGRHVATLSDINDSCYNTATTIVRTWKLTRNAISSQPNKGRPKFLIWCALSKFSLDNAHQIGVSRYHTNYQ